MRGDRNREGGAKEIAEECREAVSFLL